MAKTLMIIGAGAEQVPAYRLAKERGLNVVGTDMNPEAPGFKYADHIIIASTRDAQETAEKAVEFDARIRIDGVMTIANDVPFTVSSVANKLNLPSISLESAKLVSDKLLMKQAFQANGVACPWFREVTSAQQLREYLDQEAGEDFVIKPVDGRGARGVLLINDESDLEWAFRESKHYSESGKLIIEKFVPGIQLSTESFLLNGRCYTPAIAERNYDKLPIFRPYIIEDGGTIPAQLDSTLKLKIDNLIIAGAKALGIDSGIIKGDLIIDENGEPLIIELAARLSGGWLATHQIPAASGVNLVSAVISYALREKIDEKMLLPTRDKATAIRYWYPPQGRITNVLGIDALSNTPGLLSYGFFRKEGDIQPRVKMHSDRFGYVIVSGDNREEALKSVGEALNKIQIEVETS